MCYHALFQTGSRRFAALPTSLEDTTAPGGSDHLNSASWPSGTPPPRRHPGESHDTERQRMRSCLQMFPHPRDGRRTRHCKCPHSSMQHHSLLAGELGRPMSASARGDVLPVKMQIQSCSGFVEAARVVQGSAVFAPHRPLASSLGLPFPQGPAESCPARTEAFPNGKGGSQFQRLGPGPRIKTEGPASCRLRVQRVPRHRACSASIALVLASKLTATPACMHEFHGYPWNPDRPPRPVDKSAACRHRPRRSRSNGP